MSMRRSAATSTFQPSGWIGSLSSSFLSSLYFIHLLVLWSRALGNDKKPTPFAEFCNKAKQNRACRKLDLASFLIKPFQRITKYPLLLRVPSSCSSFSAAAAFNTKNNRR